MNNSTFRILILVSSLFALGFSLGMLTGSKIYMVAAVWVLGMYMVFTNAYQGVKTKTVDDHVVYGIAGGLLIILAGAYFYSAPFITVCSGRRCTLNPAAPKYILK